MEDRSRCFSNLSYLYIGFDPEVNPDIKLDIRGVETLRKDIDELLRSKWQTLLESRSFHEFRFDAVKIIANAMVQINEEAFMPKRSPYILGTLAIAITEIHYLMSEKTLSGKEIRKRMAMFTAGDLCEVSFLWYGSHLEPDFVLTPTAGRRALSLSLVMLLTFVELLRRNLEFTPANVKANFRSFHGMVKTQLENTNAGDWQELSFWQSLGMLSLKK